MHGIDIVHVRFSTPPSPDPGKRLIVDERAHKAVFIDAPKSE
jgi:hypothetical protein